MCAGLWWRSGSLVNGFRAATQMHARSAHRNYSADGFQLNDDSSFDKKVQTVLTDLVVPIKKRNWMLPDELDATQRKFYGQGLFVDGFEETGSEFAMNPDRCSNYLVCNL